MGFHYYFIPCHRRQNLATGPKPFYLYQASHFQILLSHWAANNVCCQESHSIQEHTIPATDW